MENAVASIIEIRHSGTYRIDRHDDFETLRGQALDSNAEAAEQMVVFYSDAHDVSARYAAFEPDPEDLAAMPTKAELGDWRRVMTLSATMPLAAYLDAQVGEDVAKLNAAVAEAWEQGYEVTALHATCLYGNAVHVREVDWAAGCLFHWHELQDGTDAHLLAIKLADGGRVWAELVPVARLESAATKIAGEGAA